MNTESIRELQAEKKMKIFEIYKYRDPYRGYGFDGTVELYRAESMSDVIRQLEESDKTSSFFISNGIREVDNEYVERLKVERDILVNALRGF